MLRKEREQKAFFQEMERNILKNLEARTGAARASKKAVAVTGALESPGSILTEDADAPFDEVLMTPTEDSTLQIQDSWVQAWIDNSSPLTLDSSSSSPLSTRSHSSSSVTSCESGNDTLMPLHPSRDITKSKPDVDRSIQKSELKRNKSYEKAINKPNLIRTISKMEYDLTHLLQGIETSPTGVDLLSPGDRSYSDLLASLCITHEAEGVGCDLLHALQPPLSPGSTSISSMETDVTGPSCDLSKPPLTKRNTCGTIYLGSTLSTPDKDALIKCVCGVYRAHLLQAGDNVESREVDRIFDDDQSPYRRVYAHRPFMPSLEDITNFYRDIFLRSQMELDCIVISLIYIERLIKLTDGKLKPTPTNWKSLLFSCMVLSSKVWDDLSMWNADFSKIGPGGMTFSLRRTNELEIALLTALEYKTKVGASEYAKYYFLLRSMLCRSGLANDSLSTLNPLDANGVKSLEKTGASFAELSVAKPFVRVRSKSLGDVENNREYETSFNANVGVSPKVLTHKVSLEHLVRM